MITDAQGAELDRRTRVVDTMLSAHSALRDRYMSWSTATDLLVLLFSVLLLLTALLDPQVLSGLGIGELQARTVIGVVSALVFFLSLVQLRVDWRQRAAAHAHAATMLGKAKANCRRQVTRAEVATPEEADELFADLDRQLDSIAPIPDAQFAALKAKHTYKVELSKQISMHPTVPVWLLRLHARWTGSRTLLRGHNSAQES